MPFCISLFLPPAFSIRHLVKQREDWEKSTLEKIEDNFVSHLYGVSDHISNNATTFKQMRELISSLDKINQANSLLGPVIISKAIGQVNDDELALKGEGIELPPYLRASFTRNLFENKGSYHVIAPLHSSPEQVAWAWSDDYNKFLKYAVAVSKARTNVSWTYIINDDSDKDAIEQAAKHIKSKGIDCYTLNPRHLNEQLRTDQLEKYLNQYDLIEVFGRNWGGEDDLTQTGSVKKTSVSVQLNCGNHYKIKEIYRMPEISVTSILGGHSIWSAKNLSIRVIANKISSKTTPDQLIPAEIQYLNAIQKNRNIYRSTSLQETARRATRKGNI